MADLENRPSNVQDGPAFLQQSLKDLFIDVDSSNMSKSTFKAFEKLLHEVSLLLSLNMRRVI